MPFEGAQAIVILVTAIAAATIALLCASVFSRKTNAKRWSGDKPALEPVVFLFDDEHLIDASSPARGLLESIPEGASDWARLTGYLSPRFEGFAEKLDTLKTVGRVNMAADMNNADLRLCAEDVGGLVRLTLNDRNAEGGGALVDGLSLRALEDEVEHARKIFDFMPVMSWRENAAGEVTWANKAYIVRSGAFSDDGLGVVWPLPRLFGGLTRNDGAQRLSLSQKDGEKTWFDCSMVRAGADRLCYALPVDDVIRAEQSLESFRQTLAKTFADLPIGLAIFNHKRKLQLFNPALTELTQLSASFLLAQPTLYAFLDRLRETRMMPEPKDYSSWRQHMVDLEQAAASGFHSETWMLPRGQTYRVTGRPHPGGAVAFLFEDISSEIAVTRRFRAELELGQNVLDRIGQAIAVFDDTGNLVMSNTPYDHLWSVEPETVLGPTTWADSIETWQAVSGNHRFWIDAEAYLHNTAARKPMEDHIDMPDGRLLRCQLSPVPGGATLASFAFAKAPRTFATVD